MILQGLQRVRFASFKQETPFPIAKIDIVESRDATTVETEALGAKVLELYTSLKHDGRKLPTKVDRYLAELRDLKCWPTLWPRHLSTTRCGVSASSKNVLSISGSVFSLDIYTTKSVTPPHRCSRVSACLAEALAKAGETRGVASVTTSNSSSHSEAATRR